MRLSTVSSLGLVSNLGRDVRTACASARAGVARLSPLQDVVAFHPDDLEAPLVGAPVAGLTDGFVATGTFLRLADAALADLVRYGRLPDGNDAAFWRGTLLVWCFPEITTERFMWPEEEVAEILESACAERLIEVCGLPLVTLRIAQMPLGHVSAAAALRAADRLSSAARAERVVLLATDSYLDPLALRLLADEHRLKSPESPTGLIPGEAGAAVLLEAGGVTSSARGAHAQVLSAVAGEDSVDFGDDNVAVARRTAAAQVGQRLASVVERALDEAGCETFTGTVFVDLNGEEWKSVAWGVALTRLTSRLAPDDCVVDYPCVSFGEIGAAGAVAAICLASRAFLGGYATGDLALILAIGDAGRVSAIVLQRLA